jgi:hypothetical protein
MTKLTGKKTKIIEIALLFIIGSLLLFFVRFSEIENYQRQLSSFIVSGCETGGFGYDGDTILSNQNLSPNWAENMRSRGYVISWERRGDHLMFRMQYKYPFPATTYLLNADCHIVEN